MKQRVIIGLVMMVLPTMILIFLPFFIRTPKVSFSEPQQITSSTFPIIILSTMILCGLITLLEALIISKEHSNKAFHKTEWLIMLNLTIVSLIYAITMPLLGYFVSTIATLFFVFWIFEWKRLSKRESLRYLIHSTVAVVTLYIIFVVLLRVPLPHGILF